jgi:hypothetical protein
MTLRTLIQLTLNAGLMKPRRGFTLVAGKEKPEKGKLTFSIDFD